MSLLLLTAWFAFNDAFFRFGLFVFDEALLFAKYILLLYVFIAARFGFGINRCSTVGLVADMFISPSLGARLSLLSFMSLRPLVFLVMKFLEPYPR